MGLVTRFSERIRRLFNALVVHVAIRSHLNIVQGTGRRRTRNYIRNKKTDYFQREYDRLRTHPNEFKDLTRMTPELFDDLLGIIGHRLVKMCKREPICPTERLLITLM